MTSRVVAQVYAPDPVTFHRWLDTFHVYPLVSVVEGGLRRITSPTQLVAVTGCTWADPLPPQLPNPVVVIHTPHRCWPFEGMKL